MTNERLLITVSAPTVDNSDYAIFAVVPSRKWYKRLVGLNDYVPLLIERLETVSIDKQS